MSLPEYEFHLKLNAYEMGLIVGALSKWTRENDDVRLQKTIEVILQKFYKAAEVFYDRPA